MVSHGDSPDPMGTRRPTLRKNHGNSFLFLVINLICLGFVVAILMKFCIYMKKQEDPNALKAKWMASIMLWILVVLRTWGTVVLISLGATWRKGIAKYRLIWTELLLLQSGWSTLKIPKCITWSNQLQTTASSQPQIPCHQPTRVNVASNLKPCRSRGKIVVKSLKRLGAQALSLPLLKR